ncbi:MAG: glycerophosphodiester phosphodiesterase [Geminicoccaceae bacterium]
MTGHPAPTTLVRGDRTVRLKWHKLRRKPEDPPFMRANLCAGLAAGASLEVDLRRLACGRFVCLHEADLEGETTGEGPVAAVDAAAMARLEMRHAAGERPLLLDELVDAVRAGPCAPGALVQLDLKATAAEIDGARATLAAALGGITHHFILSGCDWDAVRRLGGGLPGLALGYDPYDDAGDDPAQAMRAIRERAPEADTVYLHRDLMRAAHEHGDPLVARLRAHGHRVDCWTIDHGQPTAIADLRAAIAAGCDQITTNSAASWAAAGL